MIEHFEVKAVLQIDEAGEFTGLASVFGTADLGGDIVHKGAFASARAPLPLLASHDQADVIGVISEMKEVAEGLWVRGRMLVSDVKRAAEVRALYLAGAMPGLSIGYIATKKAARKGGGRDLFKVDLFEVSVVAVPMHPGARIEAVKGATPGKVDMLKKKEGEGEGEDKGPAEIETKAAEMVTALFAPIVLRLDGIEAKMKRPSGGGGGESVSLERKAFRNFLQVGADRLSELDHKALVLNSDPLGGFMVPPEYATEILKDITDLSPVRQHASVRSTSAPSVIYPLRQRFGNAIWDDESDPEVESLGSPYKGQLEIQTASMSLQVQVSNMLLQDAPSVEADVTEAIAEEFAIRESIAFVNGDGINKPEGFMTKSGIAETVSGSATQLMGDGFIRLLYALAPSYRQRGVWIMNGGTLAAASLLKDGQGNALWRDSWRDGQPPSILGRPVIEMPDMPDITPGAYPIMYADLEGYRILDRVGLSLFSDPYSMASQKRTVFHAGRRVGGRVLQEIRFRKMKISV